MFKKIIIMTLTLTVLFTGFYQTANADPDGSVGTESKSINIEKE